MDLGGRIRERRDAAGLTQEQIAEKLYVSRDLVSKWETGRRRPNSRMLERLAEVLGITADALLPPDETPWQAELSGCIPDGVTMTTGELTSHLERFLRTLPKREFLLFMDRYYYLETYADMAQKTGLRENYIRTNLSRTRGKFEKYLRKETEERS